MGEAAWDKGLYWHGIVIGRISKKIHQTFNYVPCLLDQLKDYEENCAIDRFWKLTKYRQRI